MIDFEQLLDKMLELTEIHGNSEDLVKACAEIAYREIAIAAGFQSEE